MLVGGRVLAFVRIEAFCGLEHSAMDGAIPVFVPAVVSWAKAQNVDCSLC